MRVDELVEKLKEEPKEYRDVILKVYGELKGDWRHVFTMIVTLTSLFTTVIPLIKTFLWRIVAFMLCVIVEVFLGREILNIEKNLDELCNIMVSDNMDEHTKNALKRLLPLFIYVALCLFFMGIVILMGW